MDDSKDHPQGCSRVENRTLCTFQHKMITNIMTTLTLIINICIISFISDICAVIMRGGGGEQRSCRVTLCTHHQHLRQRQRHHQFAVNHSKGEFARRVRAIKFNSASVHILSGVL